MIAQNRTRKRGAFDGLDAHLADLLKSLIAHHGRSAVIAALAVELERPIPDCEHA